MTSPGNRTTINITKEPLKLLTTLTSPHYDDQHFNEKALFSQLVGRDKLIVTTMNSMSLHDANGSIDRLVSEQQVVATDVIDRK